MTTADDIAALQKNVDYIVDWTAEVAASSTPANVSCLQSWIQAAAGNALAIAADVAPPAPPAPTKPAVGWFHGAPDVCPVPQSIVLDYADNGATTYNFTAARAAAAKGKRLMLKCSPQTVAQATAIAATLVANGQANAILPMYWEGNQDVWESWNEKTYTAAQMVALFNQSAAAMRAVPGAHFLFVWCPNVNQAGNQAAGRNQFDTAPGAAADVVLGPDGYDSPKGQNTVAQVMGFYQAYIDFAKANGYVFAGLCEWGANGWDDPAYVTATLQLLDSIGAQFQVWFSATTAQGASLDSQLSTKPGMLAAYKAAS